MTELTRRNFLAQSGLAVGALTLPGTGALDAARLDKKLRLGVVGVGGRGAANLGAVAGEHIVALCDVDAIHLAQAKKRMRKRHPDVRGYADYRELLRKEKLDALVVSTPDHTHAVVAAAGLHAGLDVYCEKPLAHTVQEVRALTDLADKKKAVTQMGTQIHAGSNYRRVVEHIQAQVIGPVREVHVLCGKSWSGGDRPKGSQPIPASLSWDLWLGPAPARPYHKGYHPAQWRRFWDFGEGTLGDMACHYMDLPFWALGLSHPETVQARGPRIHPETTPPDLIVDYHFAARGDLPPVDLTWYDGKARPVFKDGKTLKDLGLDKWHNGVLFLGTKGWLIADYSRFVVGPKDKFEGYTPPKPSIPRSIGHHAEWIQACKTRGPTTCNWSYSGPLSETVLLGNVSYRLAGKKLDWDPVLLRATNCPEADGYIATRMRQGWSL